jgi:Domain of unknown function (DUF4234)
MLRRVDAALDLGGNHMSDAPGTGPEQPAESPPPAAPLPPAPPPPPAGYPAQSGYGVAPYGPGPIGQTRSTGMSIFLFFITFGIYGYFWYYSVHEEMKTHRNGQGLGGVLALVLAIFVGIVMPYLSSDEVGKLYEARGQAKPVSALTGLWYFPGIFLLGIGPFVWFVKTNGALNDYWRSLGATG